MATPIREYNHLYRRVDYPFGYRMEAYTLPPWIKVVIETLPDRDTKVVKVFSRIHMQKEVEMVPCYSSQFSDYEILRDISKKIHCAFLA